VFPIWLIRDNQPYISVFYNSYKLVEKLHTSPRQVAVLLFIEESYVDLLLFDFTQNEKKIPSEKRGGPDESGSGCVIM